MSMINIIYTVGPSCLHLEDDLIKAGARSARLTFSYGTPAIQLARARDIRSAAAKVNKRVTLIADLAGGKPRLGVIKLRDDETTLNLNYDETVAIVNAAVVDVAQFSHKPIPVQETALFNKLNPNGLLILGDGGVIIEVLEKDANIIKGRSLTFGEVQGRRGFFVQGSRALPQCMTEKDWDDLAHIACHSEYDSVAISFVSKRSDVDSVRSFLGKHNRSIEIISKIETLEGVENIEDICASTDAVMIGRGDLALSVPWVQMPELIEKVVETCNRMGCPWIMATQIAEGLANFSLMTRAEICDVWNWAKQGASGFLLSRETAWGPRPVDSVKAVGEILKYVETTR